jgi:hypothetical protein
MESMPQNYNELTTESPTITLRGPRQDFFPAGGVSPSERTGTALRLFQSFLCNSPEERSNLSNVILCNGKSDRLLGMTLCFHPTNASPISMILRMCCFP